MTPAAESPAYAIGALIARYERARRDSGLAGERWRVTPGQWIELTRVLDAIGVTRNAALPGARWRELSDLLAPVVTESREAARLFRATVEGLSEPPAMREPTPEPGREPRPAAPTRPTPIHRGWLLAMVLLFATAAFSISFVGPETRLPDPGPANLPPVAGPEAGTEAAKKAAQADPPETRARAAFEDALGVTLSAARQARRDGVALTPRSLVAAHFAAGVKAVGDRKKRAEIEAKELAQTKAALQKALSEIRADKFGSEKIARLFAKVEHEEAAAGSKPKADIQAAEVALWPALQESLKAQAMDEAWPSVAVPAPLLAALARAWPIPADAPLAEDRKTAAGDLLRLTAEIAGIATGLPRVYFDPFVADESTRTRVANAVAPMENPPPKGAAPAPPSRWSNDVFGLLFLPFAAVLLWGAATYRRDAARIAAAAMAAERRWLETADIDPRRFSPQTAAPRADWPGFPFRRERIARLSRRRPAPGRRIDERRSVRAAVETAGAASPVYRTVRRSVQYVALLNRRRPTGRAGGEASDHEAGRLRRLLGHLRRLGMEIHVYEYDDLPLRLTRAGAEGGATLSLPQLYDLHPDARLLLLTDGRDLFDWLRARILPAVAPALRLWRERMTLTPAPMGDWGLVERALLRDLAAPIGRSSLEADVHLDHGFAGTGARDQRTALGLSAEDAGETSARLARWRERMTRALPAALRSQRWLATESRGDCVTFDDPGLVSASPPSPAMRAEIVADLRVWLGRRGFFLCAALAIYPMLRDDLTLYMGARLSDPADASAPLLGDDAHGRRLLERLAALPWFRIGFMPDWLRRDLIAAVDPDDIDRAGRLLRDLFDAEASAGGGALDIWRPSEKLRLDRPDALLRAAVTGVEPGVLETTPERAAQIDVDARRAAIVDRLNLALVAGGVGAAAYALAPDLSNGPLPAGAWLPLVLFLSTCVVAAFVHWRFRATHDRGEEVIARSASRGPRARRATPGGAESEQWAETATTPQAMMKVPPDYSQPTAGTAPGFATTVGSEQEAAPPADVAIEAALARLRTEIERETSPAAPYATRLIEGLRRQLANSDELSPQMIDAAVSGWMEVAAAVRKLEATVKRVGLPDETSRTGSFVKDALFLIGPSSPERIEKEIRKRIVEIGMRSDQQRRQQEQQVKQQQQEQQQ